ncbi:MAG: class I SAM-dependent methyltransferase [Gemmatimonadota bacterium]
MSDPRPTPPATRPWRPGSIPRGEAAGRPGDVDFGRSRHLPRLDRVSPWHVRWYPPRVLEPEVMGEEDEAGAYMDAAAAEHLARLDAGWADLVARTGPRGPARVLDVGTGGGQIPVLLARRRPAWRIWGVDRSQAMLLAGADTVGAAAREARRVARPFGLGLAVAEARCLPFPDGAIDRVVSNSLLHHLADPTAVLDEIARVAGPAGRVLLRDLRRPSRVLFRSHVAWHGRHYGGTMRALYEASVAAAFTPAELTIILRHSALAGAEVEKQGPYLIVRR